MPDTETSLTNAPSAPALRFAEVVEANPDAWFEHDAEAESNAPAIARFLDRETNLPALLAELQEIFDVLDAGEDAVIKFGSAQHGRIYRALRGAGVKLKPVK